MTSSHHGPYTQGYTRTTMAINRGRQSREEGGDDVKSARPLRPGRHTCYNGGYSGKPGGDVERNPKAPLSSDRSLQPDSVKLDSLVIAHQPWRGEYVPGPCTHRPSSHGSRGRLKCVAARRALERNW